MHRLIEVYGCVDDDVCFDVFRAAVWAFCSSSLCLPIGFSHKGCSWLLKVDATSTGRSSI